MSLTACERLSKPRASTMRSRSFSKSSGSEMLIRLTAAFPDGERIGSYSTLSPTAARRATMA